MTNLAKPIDGGRVSLGLLMQFGAGLAICGQLVVAFSLIGWGLPYRLAIAGLVVVGVIRSGLHYHAGVGLSRTRADARRRLQRYLIGAAVHGAVLLGVAAALYGAPPRALLGLAVLVWFWPAALLGLTSGYVAGARPRDVGAHGAGLMMGAFAVAGVVIALVVGVAAVRASNLPAPLTAGIWLAVILYALRVRLHLRAARMALRSTTGEYFDHGVSRYLIGSVFSVVAAALVAAIFLVHTSDHRRWFELLQAIGFLVGALIGPSVLAGFAEHLNPRPLLGMPAEVQPPPPADVRPAADAGWSALGYLLLALAAVQLTWIAARWGLTLGGPPLWIEATLTAGALVGAGAGASLVGGDPAGRAWRPVAFLYAGVGLLGAAPLLWHTLRTHLGLAGAARGGFPVAEGWDLVRAAVGLAAPTVVAWRLWALPRAADRPAEAPAPTSPNR